MFPSVWSDTHKIREFKTLHGDMKTDVLVIGGGLCGILCAYFLSQESIDYVLVEKDRIAGGITGNTTAKITAQHGLIYDRLLSSEGREKAAMYLKANQKALEKYRELAVKIECDFEEKQAGVYSRTDRNKIEKEVRALESLGFPAIFAENLPLPFDIEGAVLFQGQAQFHPLKFIAGIADNLNIFEHTFVEKVEGNTVWTDRGKITADKIIVTTHFPFINCHGSYFLKLYQQRAYVIVLENVRDVEGMYIDEAVDGYSFRNYQDLLFIGGGGHRTGKQGKKWQKLREFAHTAYPEAGEVYSWAAQDCMSLDGIPYIGNYSRNTPNLYVASGFNKWGMTSSMAAAGILCDLAASRDNEFAEVFSTSRSMLKPQLFINGLEAAGNLLYPSTKRCSHMGCALRWNEQEHTWDCPCHGSRFHENGTVIDNPANKKIKKL
ncbi:MAG: FAD-dependent oxidoreductase [Coprococcus sp.]